MPDLDVRWLLPDGSGGGPIEGGTVRIPGALPGDRVRWREVDRQGRTRTGAIDAILAPSPHRRAPPCPWDAACGGCDLSAFDPAARRLALAGVVQRAFRAEQAPPIVASPRTDYRARIKVAFDGGGVGYRAARSHDLVPVGTCAVARPEVRAALDRLREWATPERTGALAGCEIRSDGARAVYALLGAGRGATIDPTGATALGDVALDGRVVTGDPVLWLQAGGLRLRASPASFFQVNLEVNALLVAHVGAHVARLRAERVLDLYAGIGNLGLPLARAAPVVAVEIEGQATSDLRANAASAGLADRVRVVTSPAERFDPSTVPFDVAVLDPPRAGAPGVVARLVRNRPRAVVYVACNPAAAARDVREAQQAGYRITDLTAFEMFPETHHVEAVVVLER